MHFLHHTVSFSILKWKINISWNSGTYNEATTVWEADSSFLKRHTSSTHLLSQWGPTKRCWFLIQTCTKQLLSSLLPGNYEFILHSCRDKERKDFQDGCSERIMLKRTYDCRPPQHYQFTADNLPTILRAQAPATRWEDGKESCESVMEKNTRAAHRISEGWCCCAGDIWRTNVCEVSDSCV